MECNALEVNLATDVGRRDNVAQCWALFQDDIILLKYPFDVLHSRFIFQERGRRL